MAVSSNLSPVVAPFIIAFALIVVIYRLVLLYRQVQIDHSLKSFAKQPTSDFDTSVIMTMYSLGVKFETVSQGTLNNKPYTLFVTTPVALDIDALAVSEPFTHSRKIGSDLPANAFHSPSGKVIMRVDLPIASQVHFAGFSLEDEKFRTLLANTNIENFMTAGRLEGDFPDYFRLYCSKGHEIEPREVLDPTRMEFLVDFCKNLNWELHENTLYFLETHSSDNASNVSTVQAAEKFARRILPTLQNMSHNPSSNVSNNQAPDTPHQPG